MVYLNRKKIQLFLELYYIGISPYITVFTCAGSVVCRKYVRGYIPAYPLVKQKDIVRDSLVKFSIKSEGVRK